MQWDCPEQSQKSQSPPSPQVLAVAPIVHSGWLSVKQCLVGQNLADSWKRQGPLIFFSLPSSHLAHACWSFLRLCTDHMILACRYVELHICTTCYLRWWWAWSVPHKACSMTALYSSVRTGGFFSLWVFYMQVRLHIAHSQKKKKKKKIFHYRDK